MKRRAIILSPEARSDLISIYDHVARAASPTIAAGYLDRIETHLRGFDIASERGTLRDDIRPGLRVVGFEHRIAIAFAVDDAQVVILRLFYGGQDWEAAFKAPKS